MKAIPVVVLATALALYLVPVSLYNQRHPQVGEAEVYHSPNMEVRAFLESKNSPLASHTDFLLQQEHWKLLVAISAIESQYCVRQLGNNCWGIKGSDGYKHYADLDEAIADANDLITRWQARGRWLTVEQMNCSYVVPCNPNWVYVVNDTIAKLDALEQKSL